MLPHHLEQFLFQRGTSRGETQQPLASITLADPRLDQSAVHQFVEHTPQRLFGDAEQPEQRADGKVWMSRDEVHRPMMCATQPHFPEAGFG